MLTLDEKDLKELNLFIQEMPLKYGLPLLNFINSKVQVNKEIPEELKTDEIKS
jgi:hypothetical protein